MHARLAHTLALSMLLYAAGAQSRALVAVLPLADQDGARAELTEWARYAVAECFSRNARYTPELQVYDPAFLLGADSSGWDLASDSSLARHQQRWKWDVLLSGSVRSRGDTLAMSLLAVRWKDGRPLRRQFDGEGASALELTGRLYAQVLGALGGALSPQALQVRRPTADEQAYRTYVAGFGCEVRQQYSAAASAYEQALALDPGLALAACRLATLYALRRDATTAEHWARAAGRMVGDDPVSAGMAALFLAQHELPAVAAEFIEPRLGLLSRSAEGLTAQGLLRAAQGEYQRSVALLTQAVAFGPADLEPDLALGRAYLAAGDFRMAVEVFNRLIVCRPDCLRYYSFLGASYRSLGLLMESERVLRAAQLMAPDNEIILVNLASTCFALGRYDEAQRLLERARDINPYLVEADVNLAVVYWQLGRRDEAQALLSRARRSRRTQQAALSAEAGFLLAQGRGREALSTFRKAERAGRKDERILYNLGTLSMQLGRLDEASAWFAQLLRIAPTRLDVLAMQADIQVRRGDLSGAEASYRGILRVSPQQERAVRRLAEVLARLGRQQEAAEVLERALAQSPGDVPARTQLAGLYGQLGWYEVAAMHYEQVVRDFPQHYVALVGLGGALLEAAVHSKPALCGRAVEALKRAGVAAPPGDARADYLLGRAYIECGGDAVLGRQVLGQALQRAAEPAMRRAIEDALAGSKP